MRALAPNQFGKVCPHCPEKGVQAREAFGPSKRYRDGLTSWCKSCASKASSACSTKRYQNDPEYRAKVLAVQKVNSANRTPEQIARARETSRIWALVKRLGTHGLTLDDFNAMLEEHRGCCSICEDRLVTPCIDHDHKTGVVRGLLCHQCNLGIGNLRDDPSLLRKALTYLTKIRVVSISREKK